MGIIGVGHHVERSILQNTVATLQALRTAVHRWARHFCLESCMAIYCRCYFQKMERACLAHITSTVLMGCCACSTKVGCISID